MMRVDNGSPFSPIRLSSIQSTEMPGSVQSSNIWSIACVAIRESGRHRCTMQAFVNDANGQSIETNNGPLDLSILRHNSHQGRYPRKVSCLQGGI